METLEATYYTIAECGRLPESPGVYQFFTAEKTILYVGKAKNLKRRVSSYFNRDKGHLMKTRKMVSQIAYIRIILVSNEYEALLLENNLIKEWQPRYNVLLKDGKSFPYLCITNERFPRLISTRQKSPSLGQYFGPFTSTRHMEQIQELVKELYPLRTCTLQLSQTNIEKKKFKVCLQYHIGNCMGPCEGLQTEEAYAFYIEEVKHLLKGHFQRVRKNLKQKMLAAAESKKFKEAQRYKEKIEAVERYQAKSIIVHPTLGDLDVLAMVEGEGNSLFIHYLHVHQGVIDFAQTIEMQKKIEEPIDKLMGIALCHFKDKIKSKAREVLSNTAVHPLPESCKLYLPKAGDKRKIIDIALQNAFFFKKEQATKKVRYQKGTNTILMALQQDLRMKDIPMHIECFDNSNLQGTHPVAAMVVFKKGVPAKKAYRHFHIKTVEGPDDFASMAEIITRRYGQLAKSDGPWPDLIIIDGGKGQLNAATAALKKLSAYGKVTIVSIAKRLEEIYYPGDPLPLYLNKKSPSLQLIQRIRDEAHRFAITFHKQIRSKSALESALEEIPSIGQESIIRLLQAFGSVHGIQKASLQALQDVVGQAKAQAIKDFWAKE